MDRIATFTIDDIHVLFAEFGERMYQGEGVTQLEHALQCATLAEAAGADDSLILACLLHDIGHMLNDLGETPTARGLDDLHQYAPIPLLRRLFSDAVAEPARLHVEAKRYLCAAEANYRSMLSPDSLRSLALQGGAMTLAEAQEFLSRPFAPEAVLLRRWDDRAKVPGLRTPTLSDFDLLMRRLSA